jgi:ADP-ribose pyrophosphatase YjhB (NUDIX family)
LRAVKANDPERLCCDACSFIFYLDPKLAAGVVPVLDGKVLLVRRSIEPAYGKWVFPGGYVDRGEHPAVAARREALEEAGVVVALEGQLGIYQYPTGNSVVLVVYRGIITGGEPAALDESLEVGLFDPAEVPWGELAFSTTRLAMADFARHVGLEPPTEHLPAPHRAPQIFP